MMGVELNMQCVIVIPARMGASRFPGKPLVELAGKPMIQWVADAATASNVAQRVVIATPDEEIATRCEDLGIEAVLTSPDHITGTDRVAEVALEIDADVYVNVQGDEPLIRPESIRSCAEPLIKNGDLQMSSVYSECLPSEYENAAVVKVVTDAAGFALYFSRFPIPFARNERVILVKKHVGLYAYRREVLRRFAHWEASPLEAAESLEQLRFMHNGVRIFMAPGAGTELAVDTPEDALRVDALLSHR